MLKIGMVVIGLLLAPLGAWADSLTLTLTPEAGTGAPITVQAQIPSADMQRIFGAVSARHIEMGKKDSKGKPPAGLDAKGVLQQVLDTVLTAAVRETSQWERIQAAKAAMSGVKEIAVPKAQ